VKRQASGILFGLFTMVVLFPPTFAQAAPRLQTKPDRARQGDCFFAYLKGVGEEVKPEVNWSDKKIPMYWDGENWRAILPVWVETAPGPQEVSVVWNEANGEERSLGTTIIVEARQFGKQFLRLPPQQEALYTYPGVEEEYRLIREALGKFSPQARWRGKFLLPVKGKEKTSFGLRRYRNGEEQGIHKGIDYGTPLGRPVRAANSGTVALVAEDFRLHGKTIVIGHGQGVCTLYLHLSKILVTSGQEMKKGEIIGRVGATGVATGPHLHYALYVAGVAVDPAWWEKEAR